MTPYKRFVAWATDWNSSEFQQARLRLTGWYTLIVAIILLIFSTALYIQVHRNIANLQKQPSIQFAQLRAEQIAIELHKKDRITDAELENYKGRLVYSITLDDGDIVKVDTVTNKPIANFDKDELNTIIRGGFKDFEQVLLFWNLVILLITSFLSYFLAGKTLFPIATKTQQQQQFFADAAHELRNPLAALQVASEVAISNYPSKKEYTETMSAMNQELVVLSNLTNDLLTMTQLQEEVPPHEPVQLLTICEKVLTRLQSAISVKNLTVDTQLSALTVLGSSERIERMIYNIVHNAIKFSDTGGHITIQLLTEVQTVILKITDEGAGIRTEQLPHVFDRFYKSDTARSHANGSGLGLAIVQDIVQAHKGTITIESILGEGTTVILMLPSYTNQ